MVETYSAALTLTQPQEIELYERVFDELAAVASYGRAARTIINRVGDDLAAEVPDDDGSKLPGTANAKLVASNTEQFAVLANRSLLRCRRGHARTSQATSSEEQSHDLESPLAVANPAHPLARSCP
jgi:hypothetical protein